MHEKKRNYYELNRFECCKRRLGILLDRSLEKVKSILKCEYEEKISEFKNKYPFELKFYEYAKSILKYYGIKTNFFIYDECISSVYISYNYSIHRVTVNNCQHIENYIKRMIKVFIICTLNTYDTKRQICLYHNLKQRDEEGKYYENWDE